MLLKYNEKHKAMLQKIGYELIDLQKMARQDYMKLNNLISLYLVPVIVDGSEEDSELAEDLITMIKYWDVGQTEEDYPDEDYPDED